jgi:uncharacterized protein (TIGR00255 family)
MSLSSMTGFARATGALEPWRWTVELRSVNAKGLDVRLRTPPGFDRIEPEARARLGKAFSRGSIQASLNAQREHAALETRINAQALTSIVEAARRATEGMGLAPPTLDGLLAIRGVVEVVEAGDDEAAMAGVYANALTSLDAAIASLLAARRGEGAALHAILSERIDAIAALARAADESPARRPEAIRARLADAVAALMAPGQGLDANRLHQEAVLLAAKADIREELDRLHTHVAAVRELLAVGGPVGRRLDFLAQELAREANTLCAKSNDVSLTVIGLDLRAQIEQLREQIQNIE